MENYIIKTSGNKIIEIEIKEKTILEKVQEYFDRNNMHCMALDTVRDCMYQGCYYVVAFRESDCLYIWWGCYDEDSDSLNWGHYGYTTYQECYSSMIYTMNRKLNFEISVAEISDSNKIENIRRFFSYQQAREFIDSRIEHFTERLKCQDEEFEIIINYDEDYFKIVFDDGEVFKAWQIIDR